MELTAFIARVRDHYVEQFEAMAESLKRNDPQGVAEMKLRLNESSELFEHLYCVDFVKSNADGGPQLIDFQPERALTFSEVEGAIGEATLTVSHLRWDDVVIQHDAPSIGPEMLGPWFERWFDRNDERHAVGAAISRVIHSMLVLPETLSVDFGTAPPEAFVELLVLLEQAGALSIRVTSSRAEAEAEGAGPA